MKKTLYVRRDLLNGEEFVEWFKAQGFETCLQPNKLHCTIIYSKTAFEWDDIKPKQRHLVVRDTSGRRMESFHDDAVVQRFESSKLRRRHEQLKEAGGSSDYPTFKAHLTVTYNLPAGLKLGDVKPFTRPLLFGPEVFMKIDPDWKRSLVEKRRLG